MKKTSIYLSMLRFVITMSIIFGMVSLASAYQITSQLDGLPVNVQANFSIDYNNDLITVVVDNLVVNPKSIIQNLSGIGFALDTNGNPAPILSSSSAMLRSVAGGGGYTNLGSGSTGWDLMNGVVYPFGTGYYLNSLPDRTLIGQPDGSDLYSNANGSISANGPHNPFIYGPATFVIDFGSAGWDLQAEQITGVAWYFGTEPRMVIPEPGTLVLLGLGLLGLAGIRRKFIK